MRREAGFSCLSGNTSREMRMKIWLIALIMFFIITTPALAGQKKPVKPAQKDKCPVCGMFVAKYPDYVAEIIFLDGSYAVFDGAKDMFKYYFNLAKYNPQKKHRDIDSLYVTDYYDLVLIDSRQAFFVIGSDAYGPMGKELIPFVHHPDAQEFMRDHRGNAILQFQEITSKTIEGLD
jgi:copper chaperone NosL